MSDAMPIDPEEIEQIEDMKRVCFMVFVMFSNLIESGFTEAQALTLCGSTLGGNR